MKSKFKYFGQLPLLFILAIFSLCLPFLFINGTALTVKDNLLWILYFEVLFVSTIVFLWRKMLTEIIEIEISETEIVLKNIVTRRIKSIKLGDINGFRNSIWTSTVSFYDGNDNLVFKIHEQYYINFIDLINEINKPYLGKEKTLLKRLFTKFSQSG